MLKYNLKLAWRTLWRQKGYTLLNIAGLAVGITTFLFVLVYVMDELSYDKFHEHSDRIYRVVEDQIIEGNVQHLASTNTALAPALEQDFPTIEEVVRFRQSSGLIRYTDQIKFQEEHIFYTDPSIFDVFSFNLLHGDPETALTDPFSVVVTKETSERYFGNEPALGKVLTLKTSRQDYEMIVTGVVQNPPPNSHIDFDFLCSFESIKTIAPWEYNVWYYPPVYTYILLSKHADAAALETQFPAFMKKHIGDQAATRSLYLQPLEDIHLHSSRQNELGATSNIKYIYLFSTIGLFILLLACINFTNLATARASERTTEIGLRKTLGANRGQLVRQFIGETWILACISIFIAIILFEVFLPWFNGISGKSIHIDYLGTWQFPLMVIGLTLLTGLLAGSYPAFYLSGFNPGKILQGNVPRERSSITLIRKGLVIFQFMVTIALIAGTLIVTDQLHFIQNERLGFDKENVLVIPLRDQEDQVNSRLAKESFSTVPGVVKTASVSGLPGLNAGLYDFNVLDPLNPTDTQLLMILTVDHDFVETLNIEIAEGRDFSESFTTDAQEAFLVNETAVQKLGWESPIGKELSLFFWLDTETEKKGKVVGLVKDFQFHSLHSNIDPMVLHMLPSSYYYDYIAVRISGLNTAETLAGMEERWNTFNPRRPFEYSFLDEKFDALYRAEERLSGLFKAFALIAIIIACLGLFGLAAYSAETRTKEIGVRKILGATTTQIVGLLSIDFVKLMVIGFIIAVPLAWVVAQRWLEQFAYRIELGAGVFLQAGLTAILIALITVSFQSVKAALMNPADSIRNE